MPYALVNSDGVVIQRQPNPQDGFIEVDSDVICGMVRQADGTFIAPSLEDLPVVYPPLTRRQLKIMLYNIGITEADVDAEISAIADPSASDIAMIQWKDAAQFKREHPLIAQMATAFSLPDAQVDTLWLAASDL